MRADVTLGRLVLIPALLGTVTNADNVTFPPPCDSDIYCRGPLLHTVQLARVHNDSKHFVDMSMRLDPAEVKANFRSLMARTGGQPTRDDVRQFLQLNFQEPGSEFVTWTPSDWTESPSFLRRIKDPQLRSWVRDLHGTWKKLGREVTGEVYLHPDRYSLIFVPNPTIVPGGRFREYYYWDSYWVLKGLLLSEMHNTVRGMLENFLVMVERFGFVPNGGRVYYERRSQPPLLIAMVKLYLDASGDSDFLRTNLPLLEREYEFWRTQRTINVTKNGHTYTMYRYNARVGHPRPESYREDYYLVQSVHGRQGQQQEDGTLIVYHGGLQQKQEEEHRRAREQELLYAQLKSGAESGWDFSTRWFVPDPGQEGGLKDVKTRFIVPVDLNSLLFLNAHLLAEFHSLLGNDLASARYQRYADQQRDSIQSVLWHDADGSWFDWDTVNERLNRKFYPSNIYPVWVNVSTPYQNRRHLQYLKNSNATKFTSGIPTSLESSGQQWDFPNAWPPLQNVLVEALNSMATEEAEQLAFETVQKWIDTNYLSYVEARPHAMFEKYNVTRMGLPGGGGEYDVQVGFGWTNGVAMTFVNQYADRLHAPESATTAPSGSWSASLLLLSPLLSIALRL